MRNRLAVFRPQSFDDFQHIIFFRFQRVRRVRGETVRTARINRNGVGFWAQFFRHGLGAGNIYVGQNNLPAACQQCLGQPQPGAAGPAGDDTDFFVNILAASVSRSTCCHSTASAF